MFVRIDKLNKEFDKKEILKGIDFEIEKGQWFTLLGPSGCGKTTTLNIIAGFINETSGNVYIDGNVINEKPPEKRPTATVFQNYALFPHMNVKQNISYGLKFKKEVKKKDYKEKIEKVLKVVNLEGFENRDINTLSGGQKQRVALARALVTEPKLLLLDEPFSNLDAKLRQKMRKEVKQIQQKLGITTLFVTHDREEALSLSDKIGVMKEGIIHQIDTPKQLYDNPKDGFIAKFIGNCNVFLKNNKKYYARPENIEIADKGGEKAVLIQKNYMGKKTQLEVKMTYGTILIDVDSIKCDKYNIGDTINVFLHEKSIS